MLSGFVIEQPFDPDWDYHVQEALERSGRVTLAVDREVSLEPDNIALLVDRGLLVAVGRLVKGALITTLERRTALSSLNPVDPPLPLDDLVAGVEPRFRRHAHSALHGHGQVPPGTWRALRNFLRDHHPQVWSFLRDIEADVQRPEWTLDRTDRAQQVVAEERDATTLALNLTGFRRPRVLDWSPEPEPAPFLAGLAEFTAHEDRILEADLNVFGDWTRLRESVIGAVEYEDRGRRVTVMNVNRSSVEETLGVDLVYYHHAFRAFVLVQYKRMTRRDTSERQGQSELAFQPARDRNFAAQVEKMMDVEQRTWSEATGLESYRLGPSSTYLKLCKPEMSLYSQGLSRGMYLPTPYWCLLADSPGVRGPRGGITVTYENVGRYLTNTQFIALFQSGFIGSVGAGSDRIEEAITQSLELDHSVILAVGST